MYWLNLSNFTLLFQCKIKHRKRPFKNFISLLSYPKSQQYGSVDNFSCSIWDWIKRPVSSTVDFRWGKTSPGIFNGTFSVRRQSGWASPTLQKLEKNKKKIIGGY